MNDALRKRPDGVHEERFEEHWRAEYSEAPETGLWNASIYHRDVSEWHGHGFATLEDARQAAREYYDAL